MDCFSAISKAELKQKSQRSCKINYSGIKGLKGCILSLPSTPWGAPSLKNPDGTWPCSWGMGSLKESTPIGRAAPSICLVLPTHTTKCPQFNRFACQWHRAPPTLSVATWELPSSSDSNTCIFPTKKPATLFFLMKIPKEVQLRVLISWIYGKSNISNNYINLLKYKHLMKVKRKLVDANNQISDLKEKKKREKVSKKQAKEIK